MSAPLPVHARPMPLARPRPRPGLHALPIAIVVSAAAHVIILGLRFEIAAIPPDAIVATRVVGIEVVPAMRVFDLVPVTSDVATPSPEVVPLRTPDAAQRNPTTPGARPADETAGAPAAAIPDRDPSPASVLDRLAPRAGESRLWERPGRPLRPELDPLNKVHARVSDQLNRYNDSIAAAAAAAGRATDWTQRDADGDRWGISPARIHLGRFTFGLQLDTTEWVFRAPPGRRDEQNARIRTFEETRLQARRAEIDRAFDVRVRAIRERNGAKRDSSRTSGDQAALSIRPVP